jgi:transposase-like protein
MRVVFFDKLRETYHVVDNVWRIESSIAKIGGHHTMIWRLIKEDGNSETFKQKDFVIDRVEAK